MQCKEENYLIAFYLKHKFLCAKRKQDKFPYILADLSPKVVYLDVIGHFVDNNLYEFKKATKKEIAEGVISRI